ncbi:MAG: hypothetical protein V7L20_07695 [Nostoc sp.]|uniref:hypothetical protein n=1 Tax=Nostoc sp. TaxID=1180 RepID=UPI002FF6FCFB
MGNEKCVGVARTSLRDALASLLPRRGTTSSVTIVDIACITDELLPHHNFPLTSDRLRGASQSHAVAREYLLPPALCLLPLLIKIWIFY